MPIIRFRSAFKRKTIQNRHVWFQDMVYNITKEMFTTEKTSQPVLNLGSNLIYIINLTRTFTKEIIFHFLYTIIAVTVTMVTYLFIVIGLMAYAAYTLFEEEKKSQLKYLLRLLKISTMLVAVSVMMHLVNQWNSMGDTRPVLTGNLNRNVSYTSEHYVLLLGYTLRRKLSTVA